ncbi:hypothetical protein PGT21_015344 [Puccinia graminis f. sp. tritici]|uniref:Uncharacterized protein n=1 Tax=Puccinia graminis f. sp. tritici TaxID=56615 RepID=A0A5B0PWJ0_PUCGR|nr:hypothetical protein PGT21_015344 [Puccinia graminis f. sp. tritici]KAA1105250.1 hypothetical protein PGTUg99_020729 [Puccinia graminis f. sp. tritici]
MTSTHTRTDADSIRWSGPNMMSRCDMMMIDAVPTMRAGAVDTSKYNENYVPNDSMSSFRMRTKLLMGVAPKHLDARLLESGELRWLASR